MNTRGLTEIAKKVYFSGSGCIDWNEIKEEYGLSEMELERVISIIRHWNRTR